jgi:hypothetical protein
MGTGMTNLGPSIDLRFAGTGDASNSLFALFTPTSGPLSVPVVPGQTFRATFFLAVVAGSRSGFAGLGKILTNTSGGAYAGEGSMALVAPATPGLNDITFVIAPGTAAFGQPMFQDQPPVGAFNVTYRIINPSIIRTA